MAIAKPEISRRPQDAFRLQTHAILLSKIKNFDTYACPEVLVGSWTNIFKYFF